MSLNQQKEEEYFRRMQQGDVRSFEYFFKSYMNLLYTYALGFVKSREPAEDIIQDVLSISGIIGNKFVTRALSMLIYYEPCEMLVLITGNTKMLNIVMSRKSFIQKKKHCWAEIESVKEMRQKLLDAIDRLPEKCRQIFMISCVDGLKYREIASQMNISENTVKTQIKLAYKKLREDINISGEELSVLVILLLSVY